MIFVIVVSLIILVVITFRAMAFREMPTDQDMKEKEREWHMKAFLRKNK